MLKTPKLNDLEYTRFVKSTFCFLIWDEREEDWDNHLMKKENSEGKIQLESGSELNHQISWLCLEYCKLSEVVFSPKSSAFTMICACRLLESVEY